MRCDVGSFTKTSGPTTGNQDITIPVDLTAAAAGTWAIMFWTTGSDQASGTWDPHYFACLGFTTGAANSYAVASCSSDNQSSSIAYRRMAAKCLLVQGLDGTPASEADFVSFPSSTTMRINWTTNPDNATINASVINFMILSGLTGAKVIDWTAPTTPIDKAVTGAGFSPDLVLHIGAGRPSALPESTSHALTGFGCMNKHGQQWANAWSTGISQNPSNTSHWQQTDNCFGMTFYGDTIASQAKFKSMDADGFTVNFQDIDSGNADHIFSLCLDGVSSKIGAFQKVSTATPYSQTVPSRHGFTPKGILLASADGAVESPPASKAAWSLGATDLTNSRVSELADFDAQNPSIVENVQRTNAVIISPSGAASDFQRASYSSSTTEQFVLSWDVTAANRMQSLYLLIGDTGVNTFPAKVLV